VSGVARAGPFAPLCAQAASTYRVALVVEHGDGQVIRICVGVASSPVKALVVLQSSGLEIGTESYGSLGTAVCQIDHEPPQYTTCLPASGSYWVLFISHAGGGWTTSSQGVSSAPVADGDAVGFRYDPQAGADPPPPSPAGTCPVATPSPGPTPTPAPTVRPTPTPGATHRPGATPTSVVTSPPNSAGANSTATPGSAATATPTAGVLGLASPGASPAPVVSLAPGSRQPPSTNTGLIVAGVGVAGLMGLLGVQGLRRRRQ
jgi:hypothetical protein